MQIYEQMHLLSPLVQAREFYVLRYCQHIEMGTWVLADVSCDYLRGRSRISPTCCWKHPSGCIGVVQWTYQGTSFIMFFINFPLKLWRFWYCFVSCIEHVEVDDRFEVHPIYEDLVKSALGFGAKRWVMALQRACECYTYMVEAGRPGRELGGACKNSFPGQPTGIIISAASSFWVPAPYERVLKYLNDHIMRSQDVLCFGNPVREIMHIPTGSHSANRISVLQVSLCLSVSLTEF
ncbi:hypothetical protein Cgig2_017016 [Carnegiea gigantea]|uniref:START domain-containing protein n=1 Tax=Carnegiea gigantea TaxID=171969 RepID=A0A9Q1QI88_9CARY|nr:hypothetical protein Cgig2_017016 [Carnegiea gigantea]